MLRASSLSACWIASRVLQSTLWVMVVTLVPATCLTASSCRRWVSSEVMSLRVLTAVLESVVMSMIMRIPHPTAPMTRLSPVTATAVVMRCQNRVL